MRVCIRVDASVAIGSGHVMRCLTLAELLYKQKINVAFICREFPGNLCDLLEQKGYEVFRLPCEEQSIQGTADESAVWLGKNEEIDAEQTSKILQSLSHREPIHWLIVDHYGIDKRWEQQMRPYVQKIMVIDDLANRKHDCDLLLDQNLYLDMNKRYQGLLHSSCKTLLGPRYALLRPEFYEAKKRIKARDGIVKKVLIFFGGSDPMNETGKALKAFQLLNRKDIHIDVVVGRINPHKLQIKQMCNKVQNTSFYCQVDHIAELMAAADIAIGAGGTATWERCFLGLPTITIILASNQEKTTEAVAHAGAIINLGWYQNVSELDICDTLLSLLRDSDNLRKMSENAFTLISNNYPNGVIDNIIFRENE